MPCGKRPLVKKWDRSRKLTVITPSRYEQNEASVKQHWKKVIQNLELSYKDEQFWDSQSAAVEELVGPVIFARIAKIFDLPMGKNYEPQSDITSFIPSEDFYKDRSPSAHDRKETYSLSDYDPNNEEATDEGKEEQSELWSISSNTQSSVTNLRSKSIFKSKQLSQHVSRTSKSRSKFDIKHMSSISRSKAFSFPELGSLDETARSSDDVKVRAKSVASVVGTRYKKFRNPHFDLLYCSKTEADMIKWDSKYKQKTFEVSASDEFSKKAEILTKKISKEFYEWWLALSSSEFKSEIKRSEDIEDLFQVWFDEHASRGLVLDPKILPCVLQSVAKYVNLPKASCPSVLKRQVALDIHMETSPAHTTAFNTCLPQKLKHVPPKNNTKEIWHCLKIPEDLRSMAAVWDDIQHLTSTKAFRNWLEQRPYLPMPPCLQSKSETEDRKQLFVVPSDYVVTGRSVSASAQELALPVSQFTIELKDVLSKLLQ